MHEEQTIESAGLRQGMRLVLEAGAAPLGTQITLGFTPPLPPGPATVSDPGTLEVIVDLNCTVQACLTLMCRRTGLNGRKAVHSSTAVSTTSAVLEILVE